LDIGEFCVSERPDNKLLTIFRAQPTDGCQNGL